MHHTTRKKDYICDMPWWYYNKQELRNTPSIRDGIEYEMECQYRREGARFIIDTGTKMDLGYNTMATGVVYFHRFYMVHSFSSFPRYLTACCALFLAGKVEETPKKAKDIIRFAERLLPAEEFNKFGVDPKEELLILERILLQSIKFDLQVDHPYQFLLKYAKSVKTGSSVDKKSMQDVLQMAWTFVNDSLCTTLCLQWEPEVIAVAMLYLAAKLSKFDITNWYGKTPHQTRWWEMFVNGVTLDLLEDICHQVLDLYSQKRSTSSVTNQSTNVLPPVSHNTHHHSHPLQMNATPTNHPTRNNMIQNPVPVINVSKEPAPHPLPPPVIPSISNPIPNINANPISNMNANPIPNINANPIPNISIYPPVANVGAPPPPPFSVPPPNIQMVAPPPPPPPHDLNHTLYPAPPPAQYNPIPAHFTGAVNHYGSYPPPSYGSNY